VGRRGGGGGGGDDVGSLEDARTATAMATRSARTPGPRARPRDRRRVVVVVVVPARRYAAAATRRRVSVARAAMDTTLAAATLDAIVDVRR
jgi:hypothetical protein